MVTRRLDNLIQYTDFIKDERLTDSEKNGVIVKIHTVCQKAITNEMKRKGHTVPTTSKKIGRVARLYVTEFSWKIHCFCCESPCVPDPKYPERKKIGNVCTLPFRQSVLKNCDQRNVNGHRK